MGVFAGGTTIKRAVPDPQTDHSLPFSGALSWKTIASKGALAGTTGVECALTTGDQWDQINGSRTAFFTNDVDITILGNFAHTTTKNRIDNVRADHTTMVGGTLSQTMLGTHNQLNIGPRNNTLLSNQTISHTSPAQHTTPVDWVQVFARYLSSEWYSWKFGLTKLDTFVASMGVYGASAGVYGFKCDAGLVKGDLFRAKFDQKDISAKFHTISQKVKLFAGKMIVTAALIGILRFGTPFKPNALPAPTPITPFD
jgi:hypothetical protein